MSLLSQGLSTCSRLWLHILPRITPAERKPNSDGIITTLTLRATVKLFKKQRGSGAHTGSLASVSTFWPRLGGRSLSATSASSLDSLTSDSLDVAACDPLFSLGWGATS